MSAWSSFMFCFSRGGGHGGRNDREGSSHVPYFLVVFLWISHLTQLLIRRIGTIVCILPTFLCDERNQRDNM